MNNGMGFLDLIQLVGKAKVMDHCGVSNTTMKSWLRGAVMIPIKHLYTLKVRWPNLDLNRVVLAQGEKNNRDRLKRGQKAVLG